MPMTSQPAGRGSPVASSSTGGGSGIGRACAHRLAAEEARVIVADRTASPPGATAGELDEAYDATGTSTWRCGWTSPTGRRWTTVGHLVERAGRLDGLVAVAGGTWRTPGGRDRRRDWRAMLGLTPGTVRACRAAIAPPAKRPDPDRHGQLGEQAHRNQ
jgi:NAD(P)-dependent dehydrogenase (short-subunit alcohol dehydrogenase family)